MKKILLLFVFSFAVAALYAQGIETNEAKELKEKLRKVTFKVGGRIDARFSYDTYQSVTSRDGILYFFPKAPQFDRLGSDLNKEGELNFNLYSSRINLSVAGFRGLGADMSVFIEGDFMGSTTNYLQMFRLRHAYFKMVWPKNELLIGQTSHLTYVDEMQPNTVFFAGGVPFNSLNRGPQIRYTRVFSPNVKLLVADEMYGGHNSVGPSDAQRKAAIPDMQVQMKFGNPDHIFGGFTVGYKFLKPRSVDNDGLKINKRVGSFDVNAFLQFILEGYRFQLWGIYGQNLSMLNMIGGYGKLLSDPTGGNYDYANTSTLSAWFDFQTPTFKGLQFGFFAGYQKNFGSNKPMDLAKKDGVFQYGYFRDCNVTWFNRLSPRVYYYATKNLSFGIEYSYSVASWGETFNAYYEAEKSYPTSHNNRIEVLARFAF